MHTNKAQLLEQIAVHSNLLPICSDCVVWKAQNFKKIFHCISSLHCELCGFFIPLSGGSIVLSTDTHYYLLLVSLGFLWRGSKAPSGVLFSPSSLPQMFQRQSTLTFNFHIPTQCLIRERCKKNNGKIITNVSFRQTYITFSVVFPQTLIETWDCFVGKPAARLFACKGEGSKEVEEQAMTGKVTHGLSLL